MEKPSIIVLNYNNKPILHVPIYRNATIAQLKTLIHNIATQNKLPYNKMVFMFNDNTQLGDIVFTTNQYDNITFNNYADKLGGSNLYLYQIPVTQQTTVTQAPNQVKYYARGQLQKLRVTDLKQILVANNLRKNGKKADLINRILSSDDQMKNKKGEYYNLYRGEIEGQISDGMWSDKPYSRHHYYPSLMQYVGYRMLFLGAAHAGGFNIKDDPWIKSMEWILFDRNATDWKGANDFIKNNEFNTVLDEYTQKQNQNQKPYWINIAQEMVNNRGKAKLIWDYIKAGHYDLKTDLEDFGKFYNA